MKIRADKLAMIGQRHGELKLDVDSSIQVTISFPRWFVLWSLHFLKIFRRITGS